MFESEGVESQFVLIISNYGNLVIMSDRVPANDGNKYLFSFK